MHDCKVPSSNHPVPIENFAAEKPRTVAASVRQRMAGFEPTALPTVLLAAWAFYDYLRPWLFDSSIGWMAAKSRCAYVFLSVRQQL